MPACEAEGDWFDPVFDTPKEEEKIVVAMLDKTNAVSNPQWAADGCRFVARSLTLVAVERAYPVHPTDFQQYTWADWTRLIPAAEEPVVQSVTFRIRVPEVITLTEYDLIPTNAVTFSRLIF